MGGKPGGIATTGLNGYRPPKGPTRPAITRIIWVSMHKKRRLEGASLLGHRLVFTGVAIPTSDFADLFFILHKDVYESQQGIFKVRTM